MKYCLFSLLLVFSAGSLLAQSKINNFSRLEIDGPAEVELVVADAPSVTVLESAELVTWEVNGKSLVVMARYRKGYETVKLRIAVTELEALETHGAVAISSADVLASRQLELTINTQSAAKLAVDVERLSVKAGEQSVLQLRGAADELTINADEQSVVNAKELQSAAISALANHQSVISLNRSNAKVDVQARNQSVVN